MLRKRELANIHLAKRFVHYLPLYPCPRLRLFFSLTLHGHGVSKTVAILQIQEILKGLISPVDPRHRRRTDNNIHSRCHAGCPKTRVDDLLSEFSEGIHRNPVTGCHCLTHCASQIISASYADQNEQRHSHPASHVSFRTSRLEFHVQTPLISSASMHARLS